jgi:RNA polymerase sigma-70 factor (ECF subfamily)
MKVIAEALGIPLFTGYSRLRVAREEFTAAVRKLRPQSGEP